MEIKNTTPVTYKAIRASTSQMNLPSTRKTDIFFGAVCILDLVSFVRYLILVIQGRGYWLTYVILACSGVVAVSCVPLLFLSRIAAKRVAAKKTVLSYVFTEDGYTCEGAGIETPYHAYDTVLKVTEDAEYFFLFVGENQICTVSKSGFTEGTAEDFVSLLAEKIGADKVNFYTL